MQDCEIDPLLLKIREGDEDAVRALFHLTRGALHTFLFRLCRCADSAEDLLQSTFYSLWRSRRNYAGHGSARSYVYRIALNTWRSHRLKEAREMVLRERHADAKGLPITDPREPTPLERGELRRAVWAAVDTLPPAQREVLVLHRFQGLSCREIAEATGDGLKTVESRLRLALEKLSRKLRVYGSHA